MTSLPSQAGFVTAESVRSVTIHGIGCRNSTESLRSTGQGRDRATVTPWKLEPDSDSESRVPLQGRRPPVGRRTVSGRHGVVCPALDGERQPGRRYQIGRAGWVQPAAGPPGCRAGSTLRRTTARSESAESPSEPRWATLPEPPCQDRLLLRLNGPGAGQIRYVQLIIMLGTV